MFQVALAVQASAIAANVISNEQPWRVKLRFWLHAHSSDHLSPLKISPADSASALFQDAAAVRASAAAANVISNEQPCRVKLRIWRYSPTEDVPGTSGALKGKSMEKAASKHGHNGALPT